LKPWRSSVHPHFVNNPPAISFITMKRDPPQVYLSPEIYTSLWEQWSRRSDDAISDVDWDTVVDAVQRDPAVTHYFDKDRRNMLLLHFVCALHPPLHVVELVLEANPAAI
jgi:hypothetical protein